MSTFSSLNEIAAGSSITGDLFKLWFNKLDIC